MRAVLTKIALSPGVLRVVFVITSLLAGQVAPFMVAAAIWAVAIWSVPLLINQRLPRPREEQRPDPVLNAFVEFLEMELAEARQQIGRLESEVADARRSAAYRTPVHDTKSHPVFQRVGLDQDCPQWVAEAVRRAYRKRLHPDAQPSTRKADAERRFKEAEGVFDEIWRLRGF